MEDAEVRLKSVLYKFVRSCLNRAYAQIDDTSLSAEERYSLEALLSRIRDSEDSWKTLDDLANFIRTEFIAIYEDGLRRLPRDLVKELFLKTIDLCMEIEELVSNPNIRAALEEARTKVLELAEKVPGEKQERK